MPATSIAVVEATIEDLYRRIAITPRQSRHLQKRVEREHSHVPEQEPRSSPKSGGENLVAKQQKILDAYYHDATSLQLLQSELERLVSASQKRVKFQSVPDDLTRDLERILIPNPRQQLLSSDARCIWICSARSSLSALTAGRYN